MDSRMKNNFVFKSILSNRFSYIPLWKLADGSNIIIKKYDDNNWKLYNKNNAKIYKIFKLSELNKIHKIIFFSSEVIIVLASLIAFLYNAFQIFIPLQFLIFISLVCISYILAYKINKFTFFNLINTLALIFSSIWVLYIFSSKELFYTISFYSILYISFTFSIPSLIEKKRILLNLNNTDEVMIFSTERKGILIVCYNCDLISDKDFETIQKEEKIKEENIFKQYDNLQKRKQILEDELLLEQNSAKINKKQVEKLKKTIAILNNKLEKIQKEVQKIYSNKEIMNEF